MSYIAYTDTNTGKTLVANLAPGVTPEQAAAAMNLAPGSWRIVTPEEAAELQAPTPEERLAALQHALTDAIQARLDAFAGTRGYDGILSAATYAASAVPKFRAEGQYAVEARDLTWARAYEVLEAVLSGIRPMPTTEEVFAELPALAWPDEQEAEPA
jgi:hypothetical protein